MKAIKECPVCKKQGFELTLDRTGNIIDSVCVCCGNEKTATQISRDNNKKTDIGDTGNGK